MIDKALPDRQLLVMMLGVPGSGKSFFARQLAEALGFKRFSTDALRTELYGQPDPRLAPKGSTPEIFKLLNERVSRALGAGHSVIRDHIHHRLHWRELGRHQAAMVGALPVVVWIKTPHKIAHHRGMNRQLSQDQIDEGCPKSMQQRINRFHRSLRPILEGEVGLEIDGQLEFKQQLKQFVDFCRGDIEG